MERWKGEIVWRSLAEVARNERYIRDKARIGDVVEVATRWIKLRGGGRASTRRHLCTVVAVYDPNAHRMRRPSLQFASALSRVRYEQSPRGHRSGGGHFLLRIEGSTHQNMIGRYLLVGDY